MFEIHLYSKPFVIKPPFILLSSIRSVRPSTELHCSGFAPIFLNLFILIYGHIYQRLKSITGIEHIPTKSSERKESHIREWPPYANICVGSTKITKLKNQV